MVVHPAPANYSGTLVNGLLYHYGHLPSASEDDSTQINAEKADFRKMNNYFKKVFYQRSSAQSAFFCVESTEVRPGIVHRLDKETSGLIIIAKTNRSLSLLQKMFKNHEVNKIYLAFTMGDLKKKEDTIKTHYGRNRYNRQKMAVRNSGRVAITLYQVIKTFPGFELTKTFLETGRTHQIRVHFSHIHHPVMGDTVYSTKKQTINFIPFSLQKK